MVLVSLHIELFEFEFDSFFLFCIGARWGWEWNGMRSCGVWGGFFPFDLRLFGVVLPPPPRVRGEYVWFYG